MSTILVSSTDPASEAPLMDRMRQQGSGGGNEFPRFVLDRSARDVLIDGCPVGLRAREYAIVKMLAAARGRAVNRADLFQKIWGYDPEFNSNSLEVYVYRIRKRIEPDADRPTILKTVRGVGYRLVVPN